MIVQIDYCLALCSKTPSEKSWVGTIAACICLLIFSLPSSACAQQGQLGTSRQPLVVAGGQIWGASIPVCWNIDSPQKDPAKRKVVQNALAGSWERVSKVRFVGWGNCPRSGAFGDRVSIDARPGRALSAIGKNSSNNWSSIDFNDTNNMLAATAIHEFGHILGFYHEQVRSDTPRTCDLDDRGDLRSNPGGSIPIANYDPDSVMNYCNPNWTNGRLSAADIAGVRKYYGTRVDIVGGPAVSSSGPKSLDVFVRDSDNVIWQKAHRNGKWDDWYPLGGPPMGSDPAVISRSDGTVFVFVRGQDGQLWQQTSVGGRWQGWYAHGGSLTSGPSITMLGANDLYVFARGASNQLTMKVNKNGRWEDWISFQGEIAGDPSAITWSDGSLFVFARSIRNTLIQKSLSAGIWSDWFDHGGELTSNPSTATWGINSLFVFVRGTDYQIHQMTLAGGRWLGWSSFDGQINSDPAVATYGPGTMFVFATGGDGQLWQRTNVGGTWQTGWYQHP
jgi:Astacin (Peptidase family M12A)